MDCLSVTSFNPSTRVQAGYGFRRAIRWCASTTKNSRRLGPLIWVVGGRSCQSTSEMTDVSILSRGAPGLRCRRKPANCERIMLSGLRPKNGVPHCLRKEDSFGLVQCSACSVLRSELFNPFLQTDFAKAWLILCMRTAGAIYGSMCAKAGFTAGTTPVGRGLIWERARAEALSVAWRRI